MDPVAWDFGLFRTLNEAREITEYWLAEYNSERSHGSLNNLTAEEYRLMAEKPEISKSAWNENRCAYTCAFVRLGWGAGLRPDGIVFGVPFMVVLQKHILSVVEGIQSKKIPSSMDGIFW